MGAQITFTPQGPTLTQHGEPITLLTLQLEDEHRLFEDRVQQNEGLAEWLQKYPGAWAETAGMGLAVERPPVIIELKSSVIPIAVCQYPMAKEAWRGIKVHIQRLLHLGVLVKCHSPWNTPLLPVKKPGTDDYRPVQDLREVNKRMQDIIPRFPILTIS